MDRFRGLPPSKPIHSDYSTLRMGNSPYDSGSFLTGGAPPSTPPSLTILIVEDENFFVPDLRSRLIALGYEVAGPLSLEADLDIG